MPNEPLVCDESIWKFEKPDGTASLAQVEYFIVSPERWWESPKSADPSWRVVMVNRRLLFAHRVSCTL
jgi:hypothetical protein